MVTETISLTKANDYISDQNPARRNETFLFEKVES